MVLLLDVVVGGRTRGVGGVVSALFDGFFAARRVRHGVKK